MNEKNLVIGVGLCLVVLISFYCNLEKTSVKATPTKKIEMIFVTGGSFSNGDENLKINDFQMSKYEITQAQFEKLLGYNPSVVRGDEIPVNKVNFMDAINFCNELSKKEGLQECYTIGSDNEILYVDFNPKANGFRLPTEAEFEYVAQLDEFNIEIYGDVGLFANISDSINVVGIHLPNQLGFHDIFGNVQELVFGNWFENTIEKNRTYIDDLGIAKGGAFITSRNNISASFRSWIPLDFTSFYTGFRIVKNN